jgi:amino acid adenylation domain-containing protein
MTLASAFLARSMAWRDAIPLPAAMVPIYRSVSDMAQQLVIDRLLDVAARNGARTMIAAPGAARRYDQVWPMALKLASVLIEESGDEPLIGILAERDQSAYLAILSIFAAGKGYVPLNPTLPDARLARVLAQARLKTVVIGPGQAARAANLMSNCQGVRTLVDLESKDARSGAQRTTIIQARDIATAAPRSARPHSDAAPAYLLFTSGSTGEPKGVAVTNANLCAYLDFVCPLFCYGPDDCHSQTFELTFDLSVHDMMCAWTTGGALAPIVGADLLSPARIVKREHITCWFSVPALGLIMQRTRALRSELLQSLRVSLFCGEPLPTSLAEQWQRVAPNSIVENFYGPTEATIAFTHYHWDADASPLQCRYGLVPLGKAFANLRTAIATPEGLSLGGEAKGELWLAGAQVTPGYLDSPEQTAERFCEHASIPGTLWYRTGDIVERGPDDVLHFVGREDDQIKFRGHRVSLLEIENALREAASVQVAVAVAYPRDGHEVLGITGIVQGDPSQREVTMTGLAVRLPDYMIPHKLIFVRHMPRTLVGKIDKIAVLKALADGIDLETQG